MTPALAPVLFNKRRAAPRFLTTGQNSDTSGSGGPYTFAAQSIGLVVPNRAVAVGLMGRATSVGIATSVTVGGLSLTNVGGISNSTLDRVELWIGDVSSLKETNADIVVDWPVSGGRLGISWWTVADLQSLTATNLQTSQANPLTGTLTSILGWGVAIGFAHTHTNSSFTWSGLNENNDTAIAGSDTYSGASLAFPSAQTNLVVTATQASSSAPCAIFASFR